MAVNEKKPQYGRIALSLLTWFLAFAGVILLIAASAILGFADSLSDEWKYAAGIGSAFVGGWVYLARRSLQQAVSTRGARYSFGAVGLILLAAGVTVAINILAHRYDDRLDLTSTQRFSLAEQSASVVAGLDRTVEVTAFFRSGSLERSQFEDLMDSFEAHTTLLEVEYYDPIRAPMKAKEYGITSSYGTVVLQAGDDRQTLESDYGEEAFVNALIRLTAGIEHRVCFTEGHGELDPDEDSQPLGLGAVVLKLEGQNYVVEKTNLLRDGGVPASCEILIAADPEVDWLPAEREMLAAFVAGGGKFVLMLEPTHAPGLAADMSRYGIDIGDDIVLEANPNYQMAGADASYVLLDPTSFDFHKITSPIKGGVVLRLVRSVAKLDGVAGVNVQVLARTSEYGWAETKLSGDTMPEPTPGEDIVGKVPIMAVSEVTDPASITVGSFTVEAGSRGLSDGLLGEAEGEAEAEAEGGEAPGTNAEAAAGPPDQEPVALPDEAPPATAPEIIRKEGGKVLVIGDVDFATNELVDQLSNQDLLLNGVAWLAGEEDQVSIRPNEAAKGSMTMSILQGIFVWMICIIVMPGLAVVGALVTWRVRRSR